MIDLRVIIASGFGSGFLPVAPGTWGSALACLIALSLMGLGFWDAQMIVCIATLLAVFAGYWSIQKLPSNWTEDDGRIVIDEMAGLFISLIFVPLDIYTIGGAFILFRLFDIIKPFGIRKIDKAGSNWSVMGDDILAGIYSNFVLQLILLLL